MGKKKQRTVWSTVDSFQWNSQEQDGLEENTVIDPKSGLKLGKSHEDKASTQTKNVPLSGGSKGSSSNSNWSNSVAPRFERKSAYDQSEYYDGEYCEEEHLPDGFTKIRSKNLDILFRRDYYEQKLALLHKQLDAEKLKNTTVQEQETEENTENNIDQNMTEDIESMSTKKPIHLINPSNIAEFKPIDKSDETPIDPEVESGQSSPEYPQSPFPVDYSYPPHHSNLYLYSPSNNTLIPCEEIILPNPVMSPDGPVYSGPTNIYLAYPVSGPDGNGYVTQPFVTNVHCPSEVPSSYVSQDSYDYSPSASYDGSNYYSSTPQTPNSGLESGTTTQPASPPPLINYHPNNWFHQEQIPPVNINLTSSYPSQTGQNSPSTQSNSSTSEPEIFHKGVIKEKQTSVKEPTPSNSYIPGLPLECQAPCFKKSQRRKKKKTKASEEANSHLKHRGSISSESEVKIEENTLFIDECADPTVPVESMDNSVTNEKEIMLTDALAESLLNPPTENDISEDENKYSSNPIECDIVECSPTIDVEDVNDTLNQIESISFCENNSVVKDSNSFLNKEMIQEDEENIHQMLELENDNNKIEDQINVKENIDVPNSKCKIVGNQVNENEDKPVNDCNSNTSPTENNELVDDIKDVCETKDRVTEELVDTDITTTDKENLENTEISKETDDINSEKELPYKKPVKRYRKNKNKIDSQKSKIKEEQKVIINLENTSQLKSQNTELKDNKQCEVTKKSYSSIIKSTVVVKTDNQEIPKLISQEKQKLTKVCKDIKEKVVPQISSDEPSNETISDTWVKTSTRRKKKNNYKSNKLDSVVRTVTFSEDTVPLIEEAEQSSTPDNSSPLKVENSNDNQDVFEDNQITDNTEPEKKKLNRKKKKKIESEDPEDLRNKAVNRKVIICDDQIEIKHCQPTRNISQTFVNGQQGQMQTFNYSNMLVVSELGQGMSRGSIGFGRLYQGKYVPPERIDGLASEEGNGLDDEEKTESEDKIDVVTKYDNAHGDIDLD